MSEHFVIIGKIENDILQDLSYSYIDKNFVQMLYTSGSIAYDTSDIPFKISLNKVLSILKKDIAFFNPNYIWTYPEIFDKINNLSTSIYGKPILAKKKFRNISLESNLVTSYDKVYYYSYRLIENHEHL